MEVVGAVVGALTEHTIKVAENELSYATECKAQLKHLIQILEHVDGLLHDKVNLKAKAAEVKPAMVPLRQLIYEADDVITDCIVRDEYNESGGSISVLFSRFDLIFLRSTGKKLRDINSRLDLQLKTLGTFLNMGQILKEPPAAKSGEEELMSQDFNPNKVVGLDEDIAKLRDLIAVEPGGSRRVGVWGMGGLGKTTLVQQIFNDDEVSRLYDGRIWVSVSRNFDKNRILTTVLRKLGGRIPENSELLGEVRKAAARQANGCLVVMDDVWEFDDVAWWNDLFTALEVDGRRSCVIVTTRNKEVAKVAARGEEWATHEARKLDKDQSWELFCQFARPRQGFENKGKEIVSRCGGMPLSIKTIGSLLAAKTKLREWTDVLENFHGNKAIGENQGVVESLRLSYNELQAHLKHCLLCFSAYPEDSDINADQVIHWWLAEGLLGKRDPEKSALDLGREYLSALINTCLVEAGERRPYDGRVYICKMHDMVRDMIMTIAQEEGFCSFNKKGVPIWNKDSYWLCLSANIMEDRDKTKVLSFDKNSKLRAVLVMPDHQINLNKSSGTLSSLRMLDLSGGSCNNNLDTKSLNGLMDWIGSLARLACLNLSGLRGLEELPSSVYELRNLQLLVLSGCSDLKKLSASVAKLKKLIVLQLQKCPELEHLPRGLEKLNKLQELSGFKVTIGGPKSKGACGIAELANLKHLRVLHMVISSDNDADLSETTEEWSRVLSGLKNLRTLGIDAMKFRNGLQILDSMCPPETLRELYLRNYHRNRLPGWINPSRLGKYLEYLCIEDVENVDKWEACDEGEVWEVLEGLRLKDMKKLRADWPELKKDMPALRYLEVIQCYNLNNLPEEEMKDGIWRSTTKRA